jgi:hypothetical protein
VALVAVGQITRNVATIGAAEFLANDQAMAQGSRRSHQSEVGLFVNEVIRFAEKDQARVASAASMIATAPSAGSGAYVAGSSRIA